LTGELAVCADSRGPGNLHLINGLFDSHRSPVPVLAIAAHIPSAETGAGYFQETHPHKLFEECRHYCELVSSANQMPRVLEVAMRDAMGKKGVCVVVVLLAASNAPPPKLAGLVPPKPEMAHRPPISIAWRRCSTRAWCPAIVMAFEFGTNWSELSRLPGPVQGLFLSYETFTTFALEASFFGVLLFGRQRVAACFYLFSIAMVAHGTALSAHWIMVNNSWMQVPVALVHGAKAVRSLSVLPIPGTANPPDA
jgi:hypothetical protein